MSRLNRRAYLSVLAYASIIGVLPALASVSAMATDPAAATISTQQHRFDIGSQPLANALKLFANQAGVQIMFPPELVASRTSPSIQGERTAVEALRTLLQGTGLDFVVEGTTVAVRRASAAPIAETGGQTLSQRLAQTPQTSSEGESFVERKDTESSQKESVELQEVIVTAQKHSERLQDVPVPVTVLSPNALLDQNQLRMEDYYSSVPGLQIAPTTFSTSGISIRGITTSNGGNPTVGIVVDDVSYGSSTIWGGGQAVPDIDPDDLARVEVLRGPQGTLYGASSMGGLIKFVTVDPSTDGVTGHVAAGGSSVYNGNQLGYNARGSVNLPIGDTFAIRASAFTREDPGYIDNPIYHIDGVNKADVSGGRLAGLWRPSEDFSLRLSAQMQEDKGDSSKDVDVLPLGNFQQNYLPGAGAYIRKAAAYSTVVRAKLGRVDLTAITGYNVNTADDSTDFTYFLSQYTASVFPGVTGSPAVYSLTNDKFTQEVRFTVPLAERVEWLFGGFYADERAHWDQHNLAEDLVTLNVVGGTLHSDIATTFSEYAAFTDVTVSVSDRFDVQVGGRESEIRQKYQNSVDGPLVPTFYGVPSPLVQPEESNKANAFTYLLTPRFKVSPELMVYARMASGYRAGGPNPTVLGIPPQYDPDKTQNYEIGAKGAMLANRLSIDASLFYIDWKDIQLSLSNPQGFGYNGNGSRAKSQGVELSLESRPTDGLTLSGWITLTDAELTQSLPPQSVAAGIVGVSGDRLPYSSRFSGHFSAEQSFPISGHITGVAGGEFTYVGNRVGEFTYTEQRQVLPSYTKVDLHAGLRYSTWNANLFVNNVGNQLGILSGGIGANLPFSFYLIQPRVIGLSVVKSF